MTFVVALVAFFVGFAVGRSEGIWRERERFMDWRERLEAFHDTQSGGLRRRAGDRKLT